ncbi:hypothetical protein K523DRAFT_271516, partial [Schizophyllum commune Tattone D]
HALARPSAAGYTAAPHSAQGRPRRHPFEAESAAHLAHPRNPRHPLRHSPRSEVEEAAAAASAYAARRHAAEVATSYAQVVVEGHAPLRRTEEAQAVQGQRPSVRTAPTHGEAAERAALPPLPLERVGEGAVEVAEASLPSSTLRSATAKPRGAAVEWTDAPEEVKELHLPQA